MTDTTADPDVVDPSACNDGCPEDCWADHEGEQ